jgi:Putative amidase domain
MSTRRDLLTRAALIAAGGFFCGIAAAQKPKAKYSNGNALKYIKAYCGQKTNSCGKYLEGEKLSDCAHFVAHCLKAGGITIKATDADGDLCPDNLAFRNVTLIAGLRDTAAKSSNVREIQLSEGIIGDIGFLNLDQPRHAFIVSRPGKYPDAFSVPFVWAHSTSRCDEQLDTNWRQWLSTAFRLEDG